MNQCPDKPAHALTLNQKAVLWTALYFQRHPTREKYPRVQGMGCTNPQWARLVDELTVNMDNHLLVNEIRTVLPPGMQLSNKEVLAVCRELEEMSWCQITEPNDISELKEQMQIVGEEGEVFYLKLNSFENDPSAMHHIFFRRLSTYVEMTGRTHAEILSEQKAIMRKMRDNGIEPGKNTMIARTDSCDEPLDEKE